MIVTSIPYWKRIPFLRPLIAFIAGILLTTYHQIPAALGFIIIPCFIIVLISFALPTFKRFQLSVLNGVIINILFLALGIITTLKKDRRSDEISPGQSLTTNETLLLYIEEPLIEKARSFKTIASTRAIIRAGKWVSAQEKILVYFKKDNSLVALGYGDVLVTQKSLQPIRSSENPGGFDYQKYLSFQGIKQQLYIEPAQFEVLPRGEKNWLSQFIFTTRDWVLSVLRKHIKNEKATGLAEALLIGYKDDLDKTLVQSYTNTGVVHVIAISGLHLGLVYWLLVLLCRPLRKKQWGNWARLLVVICGLWAFALLAGAQPSILRSAVMFTCIITGETVFRKTSIYNTLAFSAFILLCYNPFWLWDVGFQLSYSAVLSLVIFMQPVYRLLYVKNKLVDLCWKMTAVTLSAQLLTLPICLYQFHQFPNYFLITNLIAVPLSTIILMGEIILCCIFCFHSLATVLGKLLTVLIDFMNRFIEKIEDLPFSVWGGIQINLPQSVLLLMSIAGIAYWLLQRSPFALKAGLFFLLAFTLIRMNSFFEAGRQQKLIVYCVPRNKAVDFISGRHYLFMADSALLADKALIRFHIQSSRVLHRITEARIIAGLHAAGNYLTYSGKSILILDSTTRFRNDRGTAKIDLLLISNKPAFSTSGILNSFRARQMVIDGSVPARRAQYWQRIGDSLGIPCHDVSKKGAFVMNLR